MKRVVVKTSLKAQKPPIDHWRSKSPAERIAAVEVLRKHYIAEHFDAEPRLQRVCRVAQRGRG